MRLPLIFIFVLLIAALVIDFCILKVIKRYASEKNRKGWMIFQWVLMVVGYILLIGLICMPVRKESVISVLPVMWMLYSFLSIYIAKFIYLLFAAVGLLCRKREGNAYKCGKGWSVSGLILACICFVLCWWGVFVTRRNIVVNTVEIATSNLPESFDGYRIVQFSDAHVGTWGEDTTFVASLVDSINSLRPDLIVFTGDIVNRRTEELRPFTSLLSRLKAKDGVYSILGNHDYGDYIDWEHPEDRTANNQLLSAWQKEMGWRLLNNEREFIVRGNDSIVLIGVENWGEPPFPTYGKLRDAYSDNPDSLYNLLDSRYKILLTHNPEHWTREVTEISNIDLSLAGHTHAMQMMIAIGDWKWSPSVFKYPYWGGHYEKPGKDGKPMHLYVNIGSGEVGMPSRIGAAYPEVTELVLRKSK